MNKYTLSISLTSFRSSLNTIIYIATFVIFLMLANKMYAASAYVAPQNGFIDQPNFRINVFVESLETEPKVASTELTLNHSANIKVVSIENGEFTNYTQKTFDATTNQIKIGANNATPTSGKVRLATITFNVLEKTGEATVNIASTSTVVGAGSEQILTESIQGKYILDVQAVAGTTPAATQPAGTVPKTGGNDLFVYILVSAALVLSGFYFRRKTTRVNDTY